MNKKICLVDDEKDFTDLLGALLGFNGFEVETVNDPAADLDSLKKKAYDALVIDLMMPGMDGIVLIKSLRETKTHAATPIFVLSAKQLSDEERTTLLTNKVHFMSKPFDPRRLVELVREALP